MMEQARRAAADFEIELIALAAKIFERLGRGGLRRAPTGVRQNRKPRRPTKSKNKTAVGGAKKMPPIRKRAGRQPKTASS